MELGFSCGLDDNCGRSRLGWGGELKQQVDDEAAKKEHRRWQCECRWLVENIVSQAMGDSFPGNQGEAVPNQMAGLHG